MVAAVAVFVVNLVHQLSNQENAQASGSSLLEGKGEIRGRKGKRIERQGVVNDLHFDSAGRSVEHAEMNPDLVIPPGDAPVANDIAQHFLQTHRDKGLEVFG